MLSRFDFFKIRDRPFGCLVGECAVVFFYLSIYLLLLARSNSIITPGSANCGW